MTVEENNPSMPPSGSALSIADFGWFDLDKYRPPRLRSLGLSRWISILRHRLYLKELANSDKAEMLRQFEIVKLDPTEDLKFLTLRSSYPHHPSDQATTRLLRVAEITLTAEMARNKGADRQLPYDYSIPEEFNGGRDIFRHVRIDLTGTKSQIIKDFRKWLEETTKTHELPKNRKYAETTIAEWSNYQYLPYFDLHLYGLAAGHISNEVYHELLGLKDSQAPENDLRARRTSLKTFSPQTLAAMQMEAGGR